MISIIMPLYNADAFLEESLQSIANQTYKDYELICVDDASNDTTREIIKNAQMKDDRIKVFRNEKREGAAYSRNRGLNYAQGDYISFLDGDDIFEEKMLEEAYKCAVQNNLDIVVFEYLHMKSENIHKKKNIYRSDYYKQKYCEECFSMHDLKPEEYCAWKNGPCNKLFRKKFIMDNKLEFQSLASSNDVYFVEMAFLLADRIMSLDDNRVMLYARNHDMPSRISCDRDPMCTYYACDKILDEIYKRQEMDKLYHHCYLKCIFMILGALVETKNDKRKEEYYCFLKSEGINRLKNKGEYYYLLNDKVKSLYDNFLKQEYSSCWYENINRITYLVPEFQDKFMNLFNNYLNVLIWGAGYFGKGLVEGLTQIGLELYGITDSNMRLEGRRIGKYVVLNKKDINFEEVNLVIVSTQGALQDISQELQSYSLKVIDLCGFLE